MMSNKQSLARSWASWAVACGLAAGLAGAVVGARAAGQVGPFDFDYRVSGDRAARPVQVFDDGATKTYFQFPAGATVPLILVGRGPDMVVPTLEGPYHIVAGRALAYTLVLPGHTARIEHATLSPQAADVAPSLAGPTPAHPSDRTLSSYATPVRGDVIEWVEPEQQESHDMTFVDASARLSPAARDLLFAVSNRLGVAEARVRIVVSGADMRSALTRKRVERVRQTLIDHGVAARHIDVQAPEATASTGWRPASVLSVQWRAPGQVAKKPLRPPPGGDAAQTSPGRPLAHHFGVLAIDRTVSARIDNPVTGETTSDTETSPEAASRVVAGLGASNMAAREDVPSIHYKGKSVP